MLSVGFRPFFLCAGLWAAVSVALWLAWLSTDFEIPTVFDPVTWHTHEMLFGFAAAAIAGFLLTAIPNWTGRLPVRGAPLLGLALLWLAGRVAVALSELIGGPVAAIIDLAFLVVLLLVIVRELVAGKNVKNLPVAIIILLLAASNGVIHAASLDWIATPDLLGQRLAIVLIILLISLIGGRIIPSFTRNWLVKHGATHLPAPFGWTDKLALATTIVASLSWVAYPDDAVSGGLLILAGLTGALRLSRWCGFATVSEPLVIVLHVGYLWLVVGLALLGLASLIDFLLPSAALHMLTIGAMGTIILAVMTRATLGHGGRELRADRVTTLAYVLVSLAAAARLLATLLPDQHDPILFAAGLCWIAAFIMFVIAYAPILIPRQRGPAGSL